MPPEALAGADALPLPLFALDGEGCVRGVNLEAQSLLGLSAQALEGRPVSEIFAPESDVHRMLERMREHHASLSCHGLVERRKGMPCSLHIGPADGGFLLLMAPDSSRRDLDEQARRQEMAEAVARIALEMAHEVKNPLTGLRGAAQWLSEQEMEPAWKEAAEMMLEQVDLIRERIDAFLQLGPRAAVSLEPVNIHGLIDEVCLPMRSRVSLRRVFDPSLPQIRAHGGRLRQALENLWQNALEAGASWVEWQTRVNTAVRLPGRREPVLEIRISNDGEPIPAAIREHLFEPFVTAKERGSGLGLALVQRVAQEHGGLVRVESDAGRTSFTLQLPMLEAD